MTRSQGQLLGVGVAVGLLGALAYALSKSAPAKSQGGGTGTVQPRDPWAALKTQINLLSLAGSNFNALAASSLPAGQRITAETNFLVAAANQIINSKALNGGVNVPPARSDDIINYTSGLAPLATDVASISTWDAVTAQTAMAVQAQANQVLVTALATPAPPSTGVSGGGGAHGGNFNSGGGMQSHSSAQSGGSAYARSSGMQPGGSSPQHDPGQAPGGWQYSTHSAQQPPLPVPRYR